MTTGLNGALRTAMHALNATSAKPFDWTFDVLFDEMKRVAPTCRHITRRKLRRALERQSRKHTARILRRWRNDTKPVTRKGTQHVTA